MKDYIDFFLKLWLLVEQLFLAVSQVIIVILCVFASNFAIAHPSSNAYKWINKSGNTVFSDLPPENGHGKNVQEILLNNVSVDNATVDNIEEKGDASSYAEQALPGEITVKSNKYNSREENCIIAKKNLEQLIKSDIVLGSNKKLIKLSRSEHAKKILEAKSQIDYLC